MPLALDTVAGYATNPSTTITQVTTSPGDTLTIRNFTPTGQAYLDGVFRMGATAGVVRVRSPLMHDYVQGIRLAVPAGSSWNLIPTQIQQPLYAQDALTVETSGEASGSDIVALSVWYSDLGGAAARLYMPADIAGRVKSLVGIQVACTSSGTIGTWTDTVITTTQDVTHANTDYAILGYELDVAVAAVAIKGPDTANLRVGAPGAVDASTSRDYWVAHSADTGRPCIPVFNAANKSSTYVSVVGATASISTNVTLICAELHA